MPRKSQQAAANCTAELGSRFGVVAEQIVGDEFNRIGREWLERFCSQVKQNIGQWVYNGYRWHAYSFGHEEALQGGEAFDEYHAKRIQPFYAYFEFDDLLFDCTAPAWPDLRPLDNDIYVFPHSMPWTFITTHEMSLNLGPYFASPSSR